MGEHADFTVCGVEGEEPKGEREEPRERKRERSTRARRGVGVEKKDSERGEAWITRTEKKGR
jgi:hypothetical protein